MDRWTSSLCPGLDGDNENVNNRHLKAQMVHTLSPSRTMDRSCGQCPFEGLDGDNEDVK